MVFATGFKQHGTAWGEPDELDPCVLHINVSKGGIYIIFSCQQTGMMSVHSAALKKWSTAPSQNFPNHLKSSTTSIVNVLQTSTRELDAKGHQGS